MAAKYTDASASFDLGFIREPEGAQQLVLELEARLALVDMLSDISAHAIVIENLSTFLDECIWLIGNATKVGGVFLWEYDHDTDSFSNISEWMQADIPSLQDKLQSIPAASIPGFTKAIQNHKILNFPDTSVIEEPAFREVVDMLGIKSLLIIPLRIKNRLYGFIGFEEYTHRISWIEADINILKSISQILSRAIENKQVEQELDDYRANLEMKVQTRTAELEKINRQLKREIETRRSIAKDLAEKSRNLEEVNTALRVLLKEVQSNRSEVEKIAYQNLEELIGPKIGLLRRSGLSSKQRDCLDMIENNIRCMFAPETCTMDEQLKCLSPTELQVADMIRQGKTSKEIAAHMNVSIRTVEVYRYNIRKKMNLTNSKTNLRTHLISIMQSPKGKI